MAGGHRIDRTAWPEDGPYRRLLELLDGVHRDNGGKSLREIAAAMNLASASRVNDLLRGRRRPVDDQQVFLLVRALGGGEDDVRAAVGLYGQVPVAKTVTPSPWADHVSEHIAWELVDAQRDASAFRDATIEIAERLGRLSGTAEAVLDDDPWLDAELAVRFAKRTDWLLRTPLADFLRDLSPAEAALLVLVPLLHHTHMVKTLAGLRDIGPLDLSVEGGEEARRDYETFLAGQRELVDRAHARTLPDRAPATTEIGWWLFHRWVARFPQAYVLGAVHELLSGIEIADHRMRDEVLDAKTVQRFLAALRLDLSELGDTERKNAPQFETVLFAGEPHEQRVRELLIGQVLTVAYALTLDLVRLPDIVVRHLGIPHPVELGELEKTASSRAKWVLQSDCLVLRADCHHAAELEGLRQYANQVDALLHTIRQGCGDHSTMQVLTRLPSRASADDVRPGTDEEGRLLFQRVSRFRLNERRVQDLLMGEQLYQDRGLAIRELYQNALDACRYRRARHAYRSRGDWLDEWEGRIHFTQGVDENGRAYLECRDNGIGMTESVLTEVFSQAGARFTDTTEFLVESADWKKADPPIPFHANSRFGIGVLSYFMIADEIEVVTRPLDRGHRPHPTLKVSIFGPGHLFRIEHVPGDRSPGTSVKLYLRDGEESPSCVEELRRLLGIAEFHTVAEHGTARETWKPGVLKPRVRPSWEFDGLDVHGELVPWTGAGGSHVVWCEKGGGLLVDGILVKPTLARGVFAGPGGGSLRGAVVNLAGRYAPERLSVDRRSVLSDVSGEAEELLRSAAAELVSAGHRLLNVRWLSAVVQENPRLADLVSEAAAESGASIAMRTGKLDAASVGFFLQDSHLVLDGDIPATPEPREFQFDGLWGRNFDGDVPDHVLLWRMAAHRLRPRLAELGLGDLGAVRRARPSDALLFANGPSTGLVELGGRLMWDGEEVRSFPGHVVETAMLTGASPREVARRAVDLGVHEIDPDRFPDHGDDSSLDLALLSFDGDGGSAWWRRTQTVPIGHLVAVALQHGVSVAELRRRLDHYGFPVRPRFDPPLPLQPTDLQLLYWVSESPIEDGSSIPASHLIKCAVLLGVSVPDVSARLIDYGFRVDTLALPDFPTRKDWELFRWRLGPEERDHFDATAPLAPAHLLNAAVELDLPMSEVAARLAGYGVPLPAVYPVRRALGDLKLLSRRGDGGMPWRSAGEDVPLHFVHILSAEMEIEPSELVGRLREYGFGVPTSEELKLADHPSFAILSSFLRNSLKRAADARLLPAHVVRFSEELEIGVQEAVDWLAACGFSVPDGVLESEVTKDAGLLKNCGRLWPAANDHPLPLQRVIRVAHKLDMSVRDAAERLRWLGVNCLPLDEMVAQALRRLPRA
ncbi:HD domain-containing protein [Actinomadura decatromicini]|uniref:ATP-binding protein n=1 Tax=Actinomadura decatromicini TaxID=2604572 RepID=A0A5D3FKL9_9ACTN|nr:hypothetical protein [Actinomadura decatromicini]TYK47725.1 hypothetical protein FXF68_18610 [Actinomadura decatromicini]